MSSINGIVKYDTRFGNFDDTQNDIVLKDQGTPKNYYTANKLKIIFLLNILI